jgi:hypothetical protein
MFFLHYEKLSFMKLTNVFKLDGDAG